MVIYNLATYMQGHKEYSTRNFLAEQSHDGGRSWSYNVPLHVESFKSDNAQTGWEAAGVRDSSVQYSSPAFQKCLQGTYWAHEKRQAWIQP